MLEVKYIDDENILKPLYNTLYPKREIAGVNAVLFENEVAIGVCQMAVDDYVVINNLLILPQFDTFANYEFFIRVILFKLIKVGCKIVFNGYDKRLEKFGFVKNNGQMQVLATDVKFPADCHS